MPPKGWRKNAEGKFPQGHKDSEFVSIDEILFPKSVIQKLAKNIVQSDDGNMIISKDSLTALQRSATVFVSHLMFHARHIAKNADRKTVNSADILQALEKAELMGFVPEVQLKLAAFEHNAEIKKKQKAEAKAAGVENDEGPSAKKLKDNSENSISADKKDQEDDEEPENEEDDDETEVNTQVEDDEDENLEDDEEGGDQRSQNPIALLSKDDQELEGEKSDTDHADTTEAPDGDDE